MIPAGLKAGSMGLKFLRTLYKGKAKIGSASKKAASFAAKKGTLKLANLYRCIPKDAQRY